MYLHGVKDTHPREKNYLDVRMKTLVHPVVSLLTGLRLGRWPKLRGLRQAWAMKQDPASKETQEKIFLTLKKKYPLYHNGWEKIWKHHVRGYVVRVMSASSAILTCGHLFPVWIGRTRATRLKFL